MKGQEQKGNPILRSMNILMLVLFLPVLFFFFCMVFSHETVFDMAVDPGVVRVAAKNLAHGIPFGNQFEFSMNHNNLPIIYILGRLYGFAEGRSWFSHQPEYLWIIVGCMMVSGAGFCCCEIVKKLTGNVAACSAGKKGRERKGAEERDR